MVIEFDFLVSMPVSNSVKPSNPAGTVSFSASLVQVSPKVASRLEPDISQLSQGLPQPRWFNVPSCHKCETVSY